MKFEIRHKLTANILFSLETDSLKLCVEAAVSSGADLGGAALGGADLRGANLWDANLWDADLGDADLGGANLWGADLGGADLGGAKLMGVRPATPEEAVANLDKVREIILDSPDRLYMDHWHGDLPWKKKTCAEEVTCGTTHCLAGWLQVCSTDKNIRDLHPNLAGALQAPIAAKMFYKKDTEVIDWLRDRKYAA